MYLGDIRYRVDAKAQAEKRPFAHVMIPRFTGARFTLDQKTKTPAIGQYYSQIMQDDLRNHMIVDDVAACVKEGRNYLLLSERTRHVEMLADSLRKHIDNNAEMLEKMYHKRLRGYSSIGYHVAAEHQSATVGGDIIYDQNTFQERFLHDLDQTRKSVLIVSPYVTMRRVHWLESVFSKVVESRVPITVITRPADSFQGRSGENARAAIHHLMERGITVRCREVIHQKYAIIDDVIVWYGSINLLSFGTSQESIMRLSSGSVARALLID